MQVGFRLADHRRAVQNNDGLLAGSVVSSEMAAMFEFAILPTIREDYLGPDYEKDCKDFAALIGLEEHMWPLVHVPDFFSADSAKIHARMRKMIAAPRHPLAQLENMRRECLSTVLGIPRAELPQCIEPRMQPAPPPPPHTSLQQWAAGSRGAAAAEAAAAEAREEQRAARLKAALAAYIEREGVEPWQHELWQLSKWRIGHVCLLLEQWMPLSAVSPDIHSPVEHMVGTLKRDVHERVLNEDPNDPSLKKGKTYQHFIRRAVASRGNSPAGDVHIAGSVRKLPYICEILAADKGKKLTFVYSFGGALAKEYVVRGTAGGYIFDSKWT